MKIVINRNTPRDTLIYIKDIFNGIVKKSKEVTSTDDKKKVISSLLIVSSLLTSSFLYSNNNRTNADVKDKVEIQIPIDIDLPAEMIVETENTPTYVENNENIENVEVKPDRNNIKNPTSVDEAIELYSNIFEVDTEIIGNIIRKKIDENNNDFYNDNILDGKKYDNMHEAIFHKTLDIVYHPKKYNLSDNKLKSNKKFNTELTAEELTYIFSEYFDVNPFFAMSIEYTECGGKMKSNDWVNKNNPAGIGPHYKFRNKATGVIYFLYLLKNTYKIDMDSGKDDLLRISSKYCTSGTDNWRNLTTGIYSELTNKGLLNRRKNDDTQFIMDNMTLNDYLAQRNVKIKDGI